MPHMAQVMLFALIMTITSVFSGAPRMIVADSGVPTGLGFGAGAGFFRCVRGGGGEFGRRAQVQT